MGNRYDSRAIKAFADALAGITNSQVSIRMGGSIACTNGSIVWLPDAGVWEEADFAALCGVACHEVAHVWFGSNSFQRRFVKLFAKSDRGLAALCFNAVVDVADETRFEKAFPRAEHLFGRSAEACLDKALRSGDVPPGPPTKINSPMQLIAVAIWLVRSKPHSDLRRKLWGWRTRAPGVAETFQILNRAQDRTSATPFAPARTRSGWRRVLKLAQALFELVAQKFPQSQRRRGRWLKTNDPMRQWRKAVVREAKEEAQIAESTGVTANSDDWQQACQHFADPWARLRAVLEAANSVTYDESCYQRVFPAFQRQARLLAKGPALVIEDGHRSGSRIGRPHRALIDGRCFRRKYTDENTDAAFALVFDHSGSMRDDIGAFLPVGVAMADALAATPDVDVALWRFGTRIERVDSTEEMKKARLMGNTRTDLALQTAHQWLQSHLADQKTVVLFTDGAPDDAEMTATTCLKIRRSGTRLLVGALGVEFDRCTQTLPGAIVFNIDPNQIESSLHVAIKRLRW
jgi:hypothetical protein